MKLHPPSAATLKSGGRAILKWFVGGGLLVGLILAVNQCSVARESARLAAVQTYNMGRVAAFRDSGAELDKKVAAFNDAAADGENLSDAREAFRGALADHAARTMAMQDAFGDQATAAYSLKLKLLQSAIEDTKDQTNAKRIITAMSQVIVDRRRLADAVTKKATA